MSHNERQGLGVVTRVLGTMAWLAFLLVAPLSIPISEAYWATAFLACAIFYLAYNPNIPDALAIAGGSLVFAGFQIFEASHRFEVPSLGLSLAALGLAGWFVVGAKLMWMKNSASRSELMSRVVTPSAVLLILLFASNNLINYMGFLQFKTFDLYAFSFDGSLGFQPSFFIGGLMRKYPPLGTFILAMYLSILLPITLAFVVDLKKGLNRRYYMLELFFMASFLGYLFYNCFPAAGPAYVFPTFPKPPLTFAQTSRLVVETIPLSPAVMRNALPSLHMTWVLLIWWNMKKLSRTAYWLAFVYVFFTVCGTLGTGEHYAIDLVVAFPFALMIQGVAEKSIPLRSPLRIGSILGGLAGVLAWVGLLRYANRLFWISPVIPWALIAITVAASLWTAFALLAAAQSAAAPAPEAQSPAPLQPAYAELELKS